MYKNLSVRAFGHTVTFDEACALATKHHFAGVELDMEFLAALGTHEKSAEWFEKTQLIPGGYVLRSAWQESETEAAFGESLRLVADDAKRSAALGCKRCFTTVPPASPTLDFYQHFDLVVPRLIRVAEILASHQVMLGFEFIGPQTMRPSDHKDFVHTLDGARTFAAAIGMHSLNTGVVLDSFHWSASHGSINEIEHLDHHEVVFTQVDDSVADIAGFLDALRRIGYLGPLTLQPRNLDVASMAADAATEVASAVLDQLLRSQQPVD